MMMRLFIAHQTISCMISFRGVFCQTSSLSFSKHSLMSTLSKVSSQLCKAQGKKFHPDHSRQSPYALKHEVWLPLSQFIIKSKTVAMNTGPELYLWNDTGQSAKSGYPFFFLNFCPLWRSFANWEREKSIFSPEQILLLSPAVHELARMSSVYNNLPVLPVSGFRSTTYCPSSLALYLNQYLYFSKRPGNLQVSPISEKFWVSQTL